jgi:hypothetical protein
MARTEVKPRNDAYTGLLAISFLALVAGSVMMLMDADSLGKPPTKMDIQVPGTSLGKPGEGLSRPDVGKGAPAPAGGKEGGMGRAEPRELPPLPEVAAAPAPTPVVPVKAETKADSDAPPLPAPPFVPPQ